MIIDRTGKVTDEFYALGHPAVPVYLLDAPTPAIIDAGLAFLADLYVSGIKNILGERHPAYCFLTHAHFDHCGAVAAFKKVFPGMQVVASRSSADILGNPKAIELIDRLNRAAEQAVADFGIAHSYNGRFEPFAVDRHIGDDETIELAENLHIRAIETPGHTKDCVSYRIEEKNALLSSEALGQEHRRGVIVTDCLSDYNTYRSSLLKLARLEPEIVCPGHFFIYTSEDARRYADEAVTACMRFRTLVETLHGEEKGDRHRVMQRIKAIEYDGSCVPRQPEVAYMINLEARVKAVLNVRNQDNQPQ